MIRRMLCKLGFHDTSVVCYTYNKLKQLVVYYHCPHCNKEWDNRNK